MSAHFIVINNCMLDCDRDKDSMRSWDKQVIHSVLPNNNTNQLSMSLNIFILNFAYHDSFNDYVKLPPTCNIQNKKIS